MVKSAGASQMMSAISAVRTQVPQLGVVRVGAEREAVIGAGQAGPGAGWLVGLAVFQHVG